jgi:hypothetical protein
MRSNKRSRLLWLALCVGVGPLADRSRAVVTFGGSGYNTDAAPGNVQNYEGSFNGSYTATPINSNTIVTAAHILPGPTDTFVYDNGTSTATTYNVQVVATLDDLAVLEIAPNQSGSFSLSVPIYTGSSEAGSTIVDMGRGYSRGAAITGGWAWGTGTGDFSWGTNTVASVDTDTELGTSGSMGGNFLEYDFDNESTSSPNYNANECALTPFDSGGGLFIQVNGQYELAGVNSFIGVRLTEGNTDYSYPILNSSGSSEVEGTLYNTNGYDFDFYGTPTAITGQAPESSFATQISSKQNFVGLADGSISAGNAASAPIDNDGLFAVYSNMTTGAFIGDGQLQVGASGATATLKIAPDSGDSIISGFSIMSNSTLDVTDNCIIINNDTNPAAEAWDIKMLKSGCNGGLWNGPGIDSSFAAASDGEYGVGFVEATDPNVSGLSSGQVEIGYALNGDANMDGIVNGIDIGIVVANFNELAPLGWEDGDFTYSGSVSAQDFLLVAENFNKSSLNTDWTALQDFAQANGIALPPENGQDVPEPCGLGALAICAAVGFTRRSRKLRPSLRFGSSCHAGSRAHLYTGFGRNS